MKTVALLVWVLVQALQDIFDWTVDKYTDFVYLSVTQEFKGASDKAMQNHKRS